MRPVVMVSLLTGLLIMMGIIFPPRCFALPEPETTGPRTTLSSGPQQAVSASAGASSSITSRSAIQAFLILLLFILIAVAIATRKLPAMIALPIMAFGIGLIAGIPLSGKDGILATILEGRTAPAPTGAFRMYQAIIYTLFGGMFARFLADAKIADRIIKYAAEFGGEDPFFLSLLMSMVTALIFTTIGGLPAIIMVGTVMFPVLLSMGVPPAVCGSMLLLTFPIGTSLNPGVIAQTAQLFQVPGEVAWKFFATWAGLQATTLLLFLTIEFLRMRRSTVQASGIAKSVSMLIGFVLLILLIAFVEKLNVLPPGTRSFLVSARSAVWLLLKIGFGLLIILGVVQSQYQYHVNKKMEGSWNLLTPVLPLALVIMYGLREAIIPAFLGSMAYGFLTTPRDRGIQRMGRSIIDGIADVAAPVVLMLGIGMLIAAAMHPATDRILTPILAMVVPKTAVGYVLVFFFLSPLALYRGPLNTWGLGAGLQELLKKFIPAPATMGALQSVGMLQDPTTTQNVWICGYLKLDINALFFKLFFYSLGLCLAGLIMSAWLFM